MIYFFTVFIKVVNCLIKTIHIVLTTQHYIFLVSNAFINTLLISHYR